MGHQRRTLLVRPSELAIRDDLKTAGGSGGKGCRLEDVLPRTSVLASIGEAGEARPFEFRRLKRRDGFSLLISVSAHFSSKRALRTQEVRDDIAETLSGPATRSMGGLAFSIVLLCTISPSHMLLTAARDVLVAGQAITGNLTLVSAGGIFALGFFCPGSESLGRKNRYVGIWYNKIPKMTVVWVANREQPVTDSAAFLTVTEDRNIAVVDSNGSTIWSTDVAGVRSGAAAMLLDSGNLVLRQGNGQDVWQSFDDPTDTILPEMKIRYNEKTYNAKFLGIPFDN